MMKKEDFERLDFYPVDVTKIWPEAVAKSVKVGTMTLNQNPTNYFQQLEQAAFSPGTLVPGIDSSEDKLLQGRLFSYFDTQRHRLTGNFQQIPVNAPKNKVIVKKMIAHSYQADKEYGNRLLKATNLKVSDIDMYIK